MRTNGEPKVDDLVRRNTCAARVQWGDRLRSKDLASLRAYTREFGFSVNSGDVLLLGSGWYVTHGGLVRLARRRHCAGIQVSPVKHLSNPTSSHWAFKATVFTGPHCKGFSGFGDANPSNTSDLVRGAEMRVAETRAVNRALRKAYGIGICSVEEIGSSSPPGPCEGDGTQRKRPPRQVDGNGKNGKHLLRDRLCQLIRQHQLDPILVKSYAVEYCGVKALKDASREQVEGFIIHVADWAAKDKNALVCQLNSYLREKEGAA
ncbi:MAG TPA: hypothetical protein VFI95_22325 [Terriglobales bacterium]|nr:hypothetical protein [Terriglobales bacterium]